MRSGGLAAAGGAAGFWEGTAGATGGVFAGAAGFFGGATSGFFSGSTAWASMISDADTALSLAGAPAAMPSSAIWTDMTLERKVPAMSSR